jgi:hypothetical protein
MDRSSYVEAKDGRLKQHTKSIRENQISVALMMLYLHGYEIELHYTGTPNASAAQELLDELGYDGIGVWSCSTRDGGIWETWQRACLKTGEIPNNWSGFSYEKAN